MSELQQLHGAALYNPHLHGKEELVGLFAARQDLLDLLLGGLRASSGDRAPQHHLLIGQRGMGKTMLLHRLGFAIEDDPELSKVFLPLTFPEEQYNVARLSDFWLNCTDALSDLLDRTGRSNEAADLDGRAEALRSLGEDRRAKQALTLLIETSKRLGRRLVLLVDNIDLIFDRIGEQDWALREALSASPALVLVGASASAIESTYEYGKAFYDFFRVHELEGLNLEETRALIIHYAGRWNYPEVRRLAEEEPVRIRVLHNLTGGNPRTIALLFNVLALGVEGDVRTDLERLLDQCTPLYKARFEALSPQAQQIVHAIAIHWDPTSASELAQGLGMDVNAVSSQLARLVKQGIVEKVPYDPETKAGFQIAERFFNIWYLMRASRRVRRTLLWLVEFLKSFYSQDQLRARAFAHLETSLNLDPSRGLRYAEYSFALAQAIADQTWRHSLEISGLHALIHDDAWQEQIQELIDIEGNPRLRDRAELDRRLEKARRRVLAAQIDIPDWDGADFWVKLKNSLVATLELKVSIAENISTAVQKGAVAHESFIAALAELREILNREPLALKELRLDDRTTEALRKAIGTGLMASGTDVVGAIQAENVWNTPGIKAIALSLLIQHRPEPHLLRELEISLEAAASYFPWYVWLSESLKQGRVPSAAQLKSLVSHVLTVSHDEESVSAIGRILLKYKLYNCAADLFAGYLSSNPESAEVWAQVGLLKSNLSRSEEALEAYRRAVEIGPDASWRYWALLGLCLVGFGRIVEAEAACRRAVALDSSLALPWQSLGLVLECQGRGEDAEQAYRRALAIDPQKGDLRLKLADLLIRKGDFSAAGKFIDEEFDSNEGANIIATVLAHQGDWDGAAEHATGAVASILIRNPKSGWAQMLAFFREAVRTGRARDALRLLDKSGGAERWRPLKEALEAIARGNESYLRRIAPEVRQPAREIYQRLLKPVVSEPRTASTKSQSKRSQAKLEAAGEVKTQRKAGRSRIKGRSGTQQR